MNEPEATNLPLPSPPVPTRAGERVAEREPDPPPEAPREPAPSRPAAAPRSLVLSLGAVLLIALVGSGVVMARKQLRKEAAAAAPSEMSESPAPIVLDLPGASRSADKAAPAKILNETPTSTVKESLDALKNAAPSADGTISELPPAPQGSMNSGLQDAAKEAAKLLKQGAPDDIDLSAQDAARDSLERAAADDAAKDFINPAAIPNIHGAASSADFAGIAEALKSGAATLAPPTPTPGATAGIERFNDGMKAMQADRAAAMARAALAFAALADKVKAGAPFGPELSLFQQAGGADLGGDVAAYAEAGLPTGAMLASEFPALRNEALTRARRETAVGGVKRLGAEIAALVHLRPSKPVKGASAVAILSRAEARIDAGDLGGTVAELEALTGGARDAFADWIRKARARTSADVAIADAGAAFQSALGDPLRGDGANP